LQDRSIAGQVLNMMDDPRHSRIRRPVSSGLTPRMIGLVEDDLRARTRRLLDAVVPGEAFDFVVNIAAELPMQMICILLGVPEAERHWLFEAIEPQFDFGGSRTATLSQLSAEDAGSRMYTYGQELIAAKRAQPTDDMLSVVANAALDVGDGGSAMSTSSSICSACCSVPAPKRPATRSPAGCWRWPSIQSRSARCGRIWRRCRPRSRRWSVGRHRRRLSDAPPRATSSSVTCRSRRGRRCRFGKGSANRDARVFEAAGELDIARNPNPHLGFGQGIHYCLGANLARLDLRVLSEELLTRFSDARMVRDVEWTRSNRHTGIRHLIVELR